MSKIGRKPIDVGSVQVEIKGQSVQYKGKKNSGVHEIPSEISVELKDKKIILQPSKTASANHSQRDINRVWGLHRALLANEIKGADTPFEKEMHINGLGFKAAVSGQKVV